MDNTTRAAGSVITVGSSTDTTLIVSGAGSISGGGHNSSNTGDADDSSAGLIAFSTPRHRNLVIGNNLDVDTPTVVEESAVTVPVIAESPVLRLWSKPNDPLVGDDSGATSI